MMSITKDKSRMARSMDDHIAVSKALKERVKEFREGTGGTYDEALELLLNLALLAAPDLKIAGARLKYAKAMSLEMELSIKGMP
jgi:hypothetical protein